MRATRRVQLTGGSTFTVSLPKEWAEKIGLSKKSELVVLQQPDGSLLLFPLLKEGSSETVIYVRPGQEVDEVLREYISRYLTGFDVIKIKFTEGTTELASEAKELIRRWLIGVEVVYESASELITQCLPMHTSFPIKRSIERMSHITIGMLREALTSMEKADVALASGIAIRDDEVDRFYHLIIRQLNVALLNPLLADELDLLNKQDALSYIIVAKSVERAADHAVSISENAIQLIRSHFRVPASLLNCGRGVVFVFEEAITSLFELDVTKANGVIREVRKLEEELSGVRLPTSQKKETTLFATSLRLIIESLKRVAEYSSDIAEAVINLHSDRPNPLAPDVILKGERYGQKD